MSSICVILDLVVTLDLEIEQMNVKIAFLHGDLEEEIYMEQPESFKVKGKDNYVCKLKKSLWLKAIIETVVQKVCFSYNRIGL